MLKRRCIQVFSVVLCGLILAPIAFGQDAMRPDRPPPREAPKPASKPEKPARVEAPKPPEKSAPTESAPKPAELPKPDLSDLPEKISGEKVEILLKSGSDIVGVAKDNRIEVRMGKLFKKVDNPNLPNAGIRVYYMKGLNGYLFVPYRTIEDIQFLGAVTPEESVQIIEGLKAGRFAALERRLDAVRGLQDRREARAAALAEREKVAETALEEEADPEHQQAIAALMQRFPPEKWTPEKLDEIRRRELIMNLKPTDQEREWMSSFDLWLQGYIAWVKSRDEESRKERLSLTGLLAAETSRLG